MGFYSVLSRSVSNHSPILLDEDDTRKEITSFNFTNMWIKVDNLKDLTKN